MNGNENCDDRGPRIGSEGVPRCHRPKGHDGEHRAAVEDGWGDVRWSNLTRPVTAPLPPDPADVLTRLEELHKAATPGAWVHNPVNGVHTPTGSCIALSYSHDDDRRRADAAAIVAEHNAMPALLAVARSVLALAEEAKRASTYTDWHAIAARLSAVAAALGETGGGQ